MDERIVKYQEKMDKTLANLDSEFGTIRAGRANPHVLDRIMVEYYGAPTPLHQGRSSENGVYRRAQWKLLSYKHYVRILWDPRRERSVIYLR